MYEKIIPIQEFVQYDRETQRHMFIKWRELYSNAEIMKKAGIQGNNAFQKIIKGLDIPLKQTRKVPGKRQAKTTTAVKVQPSPVEGLPKQEINTIQQNPIKIIINGLHLEYNGIFDPDQLAKIFTKLQLLVDGEDSDYYLTLTLTEEPTSREEESEDIKPNEMKKSLSELSEELKIHV